MSYPEVPTSFLCKEIPDGLESILLYKNFFASSKQSKPSKLININKKIVYLANNAKENHNILQRLCVLFYNQFYKPKIILYPSIKKDKDKDDDYALKKTISQKIKALEEIKNSDTFILLMESADLSEQFIPNDIRQNLKFSLSSDRTYAIKDIRQHLEQFHYISTTQVCAPGEYAVRGGLIDIFPAHSSQPLRLDFFGNTLQTIKQFDPQDQRTTDQKIQSFDVFSTQADIFKHIYSNCQTLFEYINSKNIPFLYDCDKELLNLPDDNHKYSSLYSRNSIKENEETSYVPNFHISYKKNRTNDHKYWLDAIREYIKNRHQSNKKIYIACSHESNMEHILNLFQNNIKDYQWKTVAKDKSFFDQNFSICIFPISCGFETREHVFITPYDLFGVAFSTKIRTSKITKRKNDISALVENFSFEENDLVVHRLHGVGCFKKLTVLNVCGVLHDCLLLMYADQDKLYVPVENMDLISMYGTQTSEVDVRLDKLGSATFQKRAAKLKKRLMEMADTLIKVAAARTLKKAAIFTIPDGLYEEFCARFPFVETEDQIQTINSVIEDLASGHPMDRLVCGDVGFGKTEVALRAAMIVALGGGQVAIVTPTTLLTRQHAHVFQERFQDMPVKIASLSRLIDKKEREFVKKSLKNGEIDIVIGTHGLLSKDIVFKNLCLIIVDEEHHFGVAHKERLKSLQEDAHVLTLTATPIPRTLQMSFAGLKELSIIATPPIDRCVIRTYINTFNANIAKKALLKEHERNGQSFFIVQKIKNLPEIEDFLRKELPELQFVTAHGKMKPSALEKIMTSFYDNHFDILLSTTIVESGIDIPNANTIIIYNAHCFGLAQLHQLRGRVGRSEKQAYAHLFLPSHHNNHNDNYKDEYNPDKLQQTLSRTSRTKKRMALFETLDSLGSGFTLASMDMDMRGCGNLLGQEQSGHIKEVGAELYQNLLQEAIQSLKMTMTENANISLNEYFSPIINVCLSIYIPDEYVNDTGTRMYLYKKLSHATSDDAVNDIREEIKDRFGPPPESVMCLLEIVKIKNICKKKMIDKVDVGESGFVFSFYKNQCSDLPQFLIWLEKNKKVAKLRSDHKIFVSFSKKFGRKELLEHLRFFFFRFLNKN